MGAYRIQTLYRRGVRVRVELGFSIDETIGGQLTAGDHSRHYNPTLDCKHMCSWITFSVFFSGVKNLILQHFPSAMFSVAFVGQPLYWIA